MPIANHQLLTLKLFLTIVSFVFSCCGIGCDRDDRPTVVLYVSADEHIARQVISEFEQASGIRVLLVGDTEAKKTTGLVERLRNERNQPQADVFWSSEVFMTIELANEGIFEPYQSPATKDWPNLYRDPQGRWYGFAARARVIVYASDRVTKEELPTTWMGLTHDRFKNRLVMADPRFGTTGGHLAAMKAYWDRHVMPGYYAAFLEGLAANHVRLLPSGNAGVVEAVARGEADFGMTDTDDVWAAQARGHRVEAIYPNHEVEPGATGIGTLLIPNTVAKIKGSPHPEQAALLVDFLLSEKVERMLSESVSHNVPLRHSIAADERFAVPDPLRVDLQAAAAARKSAVEQAMRILQPSKSEASSRSDSDQREQVATPDVESE